MDSNNNQRGAESKNINAEPEEFVVEEVLAEDIADVKGKAVKLYLVKWEGYGLDECTWEPESSFDTKQTLKDWRAKYKRIARGEIPAFDLKLYNAAIEAKANPEANREDQAKQADTAGTPSDINSQSPSSPDTIFLSYPDDEENSSAPTPKKARLSHSSSNTSKGLKKGQARHVGKGLQRLKRAKSQSNAASKRPRTANDSFIAENLASPAPARIGKSEEPRLEVTGRKEPRQAQVYSEEQQIVTNTVAKDKLSTLIPLSDAEKPIIAQSLAGQGKMRPKSGLEGRVLIDQENLGSQSSGSMSFDSLFEEEVLPDASVPYVGPPGPELSIRPAAPEAAVIEPHIVPGNFELPARSVIAEPLIEPIEINTSLGLEPLKLREQNKPPGKSIAQLDDICKIPPSFFRKPRRMSIPATNLPQGAESPLFVLSPKSPNLQAKSMPSDPSEEPLAALELRDENEAIVDFNPTEPDKENRSNPRAQKRSPSLSAGHLTPGHLTPIHHSLVDSRPPDKPHLQIFDPNLDFRNLKPAQDAAVDDGDLEKMQMRILIQVEKPETEIRYLNVTLHETGLQPGINFLLKKFHSLYNNAIRLDQAMLSLSLDLGKLMNNRDRVIAFGNVLIDPNDRMSLAKAALVDRFMDRTLCVFLCSRYNYTFLLVPKSSQSWRPFSMGRDLPEDTQFHYLIIDGLPLPIRHSPDISYVTNGVDAPASFSASQIPNLDVFESLFKVPYAKLSRGYGNFFLCFPDKAQAQCNFLHDYLVRRKARGHAPTVESSAHDWWEWQSNSGRGVLLVHSSFDYWHELRGLHHILRKPYPIFELDFTFKTPEQLRADTDPNMPRWQLRVRELFPMHTGTLFFSEAVARHHPHDLNDMLRWFARVHNEYPHQWQCYCPPNFKQLALNLALSDQGGDADDAAAAAAARLRIFKLVDALCPDDSMITSVDVNADLLEQKIVATYLRPTVSHPLYWENSGPAYEAVPEQKCRLLMDSFAKYVFKYRKRLSRRMIAVVTREEKGRIAEEELPFIEVCTIDKFWDVQRVVIDEDLAR